MSMPLGSVHTISVSTQCSYQPWSPCFGLRCVCTLLPLVSVVARDPRFEQNALRIVFGLYIYARFVILKRPCQRIASAKVVP